MVYFILGNHPKLSIAEIEATVGKRASAVRGGQVLFMDLEQPNLGELMQKLAGVVKIGHVIGEFEDYNEEELADLIAADAMGAQGKNKIRFGVSVYDLGAPSDARAIIKRRRSLAGEIKTRLKEVGRPVRYVGNNDPELSSAAIEGNKLLESGSEFVLFVASGVILVGKTEGIQDFIGWSDRDYGRPARDKKSGMLPPKLARMMINLAGMDLSETTLLDPFCGSGTVLMEAHLMGAKRLVGSDISPKAIADTKTNLDWMVKRFDVGEPVVDLIESPAAEVPLLFKEGLGVVMPSIDLIVTEVFLGPPRFEAVSASTATQLERELLPMYQDSFSTLSGVVRSGGRAVVAFPAFKRKDPSSPRLRGTKDGDWHHLPLEDILIPQGWELDDRFIYARPDANVARDIYVLTRK